MGMVQEIMDILQQGYGMTSASPVDRVVASRVIEHFIRKGWLAANEVAHIVKAAGGKVIVSQEQLEDSDPQLVSYRDFMTDTIVFESRDNK